MCSAEIGGKTMREGSPSRAVWLVCAVCSVVLVPAGHLRALERLRVDPNRPHLLLAGDKPIFLAGYYEAPDDAAPKYSSMYYFLDKNAEHGCNTYRLLLEQHFNPYYLHDPWDNDDCGQANEAYYDDFLRPFCMYARDRGIYVVVCLYRAGADWSCQNKTDAARKRTYDKVLEHTWDLGNVLIETNWEVPVHSNDFLYGVADYTQSHPTYPGILAIVTDWHHRDLYGSPYSDCCYSDLGPNKVMGRHRGWDRATSLAYWDENRPALWTECWFRWPGASGGSDPMSEKQARVYLYRAALFCGQAGIQFYYTRWNAPDHPDLPPSYLEQCGHAVGLASRLPLADMLPEERVAGFSADGDWLVAPGRCYAGYLKEGGEVWVNLSDLRGETEYYWFNPRSGAITGQGKVIGGGDRRFSAPDAADWVLIIGCCEPSVADAPPRVGVGHAMAISLKDEYRKQVIPLAAAAGAEYTALYLLRNTANANYPGEDGSFLDLDIQAFNGYDASRGYNEVWWSRFADYLNQCRSHNIAPIVSLYDFCCSGAGPFGGYNQYDSADRDYVARVVQYLNRAGVDYIINIGVERGPGGGLGPSTGFLNDCMAHLMTLGVSLSEQICISDELLDDHYTANDIIHIPGYVTDHGSYIPGDTSGHGRWSGPARKTINDEERMGGGGYPVECSGSWGSGWGGSGRTQQYVDYLTAAHDGIACMSFWHLKAFNNCQEAVGGEDMKAIFAPNQRSAMMMVFPPALPQTVLLVGDMPGGGTLPKHIADDHMAAHLANDLGFVVTRVSGSASSAAQAADKKLVVISESISSSTVLAKFKDIAVGVLVMEPFILDDMLMTSAQGGIPAQATVLTIVDDTHPLAAGFPAGDTTVYTALGSISQGTPSANAAIVGKVGSDNVIFAYETGASMVGMNAPARRVGFFLSAEGGEFDKLTPQGLALFDAAVNWTKGPVATEPPEKATNPSPPDLQAGVSRSADLTWTAGAGATSHDVYFGETDLPESWGNQLETTFDPGILRPGTRYYWRIDEVNTAGKTSGDLWSFISEHPCDFDNDGDVDQADFGQLQVCLAGPELCETGYHSADLDGDGDVDQDDLAMFSACMTGPNMLPDRDCLK